MNLMTSIHDVDTIVCYVEFPVGTAIDLRELTFEESSKIVRERIAHCLAETLEVILLKNLNEYSEREIIASPESMHHIFRTKVKLVRVNTNTWSNN